PTRRGRRRSGAGPGPGRPGRRASPRGCAACSRVRARRGRPRAASRRRRSRAGPSPPPPTLLRLVAGVVLVLRVLLLQRLEQLVCRVVGQRLVPRLVVVLAGLRLVVREPTHDSCSLASRVLQDAHTIPVNQLACKP